MFAVCKVHKREACARRCGTSVGKGLSVWGKNRESVPEKVKVDPGQKGGKWEGAVQAEGTTRGTDAGVPSSSCPEHGGQGGGDPAACWGLVLGHSQVQSGGKAPGDPAAFCKTA